LRKTDYETLTLLTLLSLFFTAGAQTPAQRDSAKRDSAPCYRKGFSVAAASVPGLWPAGQVTNKQIACRTNNLQAILLLYYQAQTA